MKILHLSTDNKFLSLALSSFEENFPECNYLWLLNSDNRVCDKQKSINTIDCLDFRLIRELNKFDVVILHSLDIYWYPFILFSKNIKFVWIGWGFDYYDIIYSKYNMMLLEKTGLIIKKGISIKSRIILLITKLFKRRVISKINVFSPVLKSEYFLVKSKLKIKNMPQYVSWNYGNLEDNLLKGFFNKKTNGTSILVGNSATDTNNHIEIFELLKDLKIDNNCIVPLSYGDSEYKNIIIKKGYELLGNKFIPLNDFLKYQEYISLIMGCNTVIMNHKRQQGLGNLIIMIYLGAKVYLRKDNPIYREFKKEGFIIFSIDDLKNQHSSLSEKLKHEEIIYNRVLLEKRYSKKIINEKTYNLVNSLIYINQQLK